MRHPDRRGGSRTCGLALLLSTVVLVWMAQPAFGIPAFARKYETSCHTCHSVYPKLNPFGNAFRMRGYRMPGETEDMVKQEPVKLGADANKRLWPNAIWPSTIPSHVPLSIDVRLATVSTHDAATNDTRWNDWRLPESIELLAGGTFGDTISYLAALEVEIEGDHGESATEVTVGHAEAHFNGPWGTGTRFNVKLGRFSPEATQQFNHGYLGADTVPAAMFGFNPLGFHGSAEVGAGGHHGGGGGISLPAGVDGLEVYGIVGHRFDYSVGAANGMGPGDGYRDGNESKDYFARVGYKFGGMSLDGEGDDREADPKNWREKSVRVGIFGYDGDGEDILFQGTGHHASDIVENREFSRYGVDVNAYFKDLNLIVGFVDGEDTLAEYTTEVGHGDEHGEENGDEHDEPGGLTFVEIGDYGWDAFFAEVDYVFFPWLHGAVRYERLDPSDPRREDFERFVLNVSALVRANVKAVVEYQEDTGGLREDNYEIKGVLRFAY